MKLIDRWFEHAQKSEDHLISFFYSVVTGTLTRYFSYRLRNVMTLATLMFVVRAAEFLIIYKALGHLAAFIVLTLRVGTLLVDGAWWGFMEVMRERLRSLSEEGQARRSEEEVGNWLILSAMVAMAILLTAAIVVVFAVLPSEAGLFVGVYSFFVVLELVAKLPVVTIHSGMYATRRIYRPTWSIFAPLLIQLAVLGAGYVFFPAGALLLSILCSATAATYLGLRYTLRVYELTGRKVTATFKPRIFLDFLKGLPAGKAFLSLFAGLCLQLDALFALVLLGVLSGRDRTIDLMAADPAWHIINGFAFFYLILPAFRGSYEWARIFYFDLVRLRRNEEYREIRRVFFRLILLTAPLVSIYFWLLSFTLGFLEIHNFSGTFISALLPLFLLRALIGVYQIRMFADGRLLSVIGSVALFVFGLWLVWLDPEPASDLLEVTAVMIVVLVVLINLQHFRDRKRRLPVQLELTDWFDALGSVHEQVSIGEMRIAPRVPDMQRLEVANAVRRSLAGIGHFSFRDQRTLVFFVRRHGAGRDLTSELSRSSGGAASAVHDGSAEFPDGRSAAAALRLKWPRAAHRIARRPIEALKSDFSEMFSEGALYDTATGEGWNSMRRIDRQVSRLALPGMLRGFRNGKMLTFIKGYLLMPVFRDGALRLLLVLPPDADDDALRRWHDAMARSENGEFPETKPAGTDG